MIDLLEKMNTKEAVMLCMCVLTLVFCLFNLGILGLFMHFQSHKRTHNRHKILAAIAESEAKILKRINSFISHVG